MPVLLNGGGRIVGYLEEIGGSAEPVLQTENGQIVAQRAGSVTYMGGLGDDAALDRLIADLALRAGIDTRVLPEGVRIRETGAERFWFNHNATDVTTEIGTLPPAGVHIEALRGMPKSL